MSRVPPQHASDKAYIVTCRLLARNKTLMTILTRLRDARYPDAWVVSGAIVQTVWNALAGRDVETGIVDYDIIYHDGEINEQAEQRRIAVITGQMRDLDTRLDICNQARVHLWYPEKFGSEYPVLHKAVDSLGYYPSKTTAVAVRLDGLGRFDIMAPFGLENMLNRKIVPNHALATKEQYEAKANRWKSEWPELRVLPWQ